MSGGLHRLLAPVEEPGLETPDVSAAPEWLTADGWRVYATLLPAGQALSAVAERFVDPRSQAVDATYDPASGELNLPFSPEEAYANFVGEAWRSAVSMSRLSERQLNAFYAVKRAIPRRLQLAARRALVRRQHRADFPHWPFEPSLHRLLLFYARCLLVRRRARELAFRWFWPEGRPWAFTLTHDVESAEGLRLSVELADLEEQRGFRSSFNVVADWYPVDEGILRELQARGFEIGLHGIHHDRSLFSSRAEFERQRAALAAAAERFGAEGFRSPATHRVDEWLGELPVEYDCTVPHADPYEPQPGGCFSLWPFFVGNLVEIPWTVPQDHTVFTLLGQRTPALWLGQVNAIRERHGLAQFVTHPDPGYLGERRNRGVYEQTLDALVEDDTAWHALPREVARWWRERDSGESPRVRLGSVRHEEDAPGGVALGGPSGQAA
jgi:peptidoglycan/xylan/chitin deacetylase (PgdA/CDA1 family)